MSGDFQNNVLHVFLLELLFKNKQLSSRAPGYVGPWWLSVLNIAVCPCPSQTLMLCSLWDRRVGENGAHVYIWLSLFVVHLKLSQQLYSKSILALRYSLILAVLWSQPLSKLVRWLEEHLGLFSGSIIRQGLQMHFGSLATEVRLEWSKSLHGILIHEDVTFPPSLSVTSFEC